MIERVEACAYGCKISRKHRVECQTDACPGCLPRPSEVGQLCQWCWRQLGEHVASIPALCQHLEEMGQPHAQTARYDREGGTRGDAAEGDPYPQAWHARDALGASLWGWCKVVAEERLGQPAPNVEHGQTAAEWIAPHLEWAAGQDWIADMRAEVATLTSTSLARWPMQERWKRVDMPCPRCDLLTLVYTPPSAEGAAFVVSCDNPDCARVFSEDEFEWFKHMALKIGGAA